MTILALIFAWVFGFLLGYYLGRVHEDFVPEGYRCVKCKKRLIKCKCRQEDK